jgi:alpha-galactosidase
MLNTLGTNVTKTATWKEIPELNDTKHDKYLVHDMWTGEDLGEFTNSFSIKIRSHDTAALRLTRVDGKFKTIPHRFTTSTFGNRSIPAYWADRH